MQKIFLNQVYNNLAYVPPTYWRFKKYNFSISTKNYVSPYHIKRK